MSTTQVRSSAGTAGIGRVIRLVVLGFVASLVASLMGFIPAATAHASTVQATSSQALTSAIEATRTSTAVRTRIVAHRAAVVVKRGPKVTVIVGVHSRATATVTVTRAGRSLTVTQAATGYSLTRVTLNVTPQPTWNAYLRASNATVVKARTIALGIGGGGESRQPLGVTMVGGLLFSQMLTLFVTPVFYVCLEHLRHKWHRKAHIEKEVEQESLA